MEGCSKYCSYCVVPYTRGVEISRPFDDVLAEISGLTEKGVREVTLLGQNVNAYRGKMADGDIADLGLLLHYVSAIEGIERIRYTTSHPMELNDSLIQAHGEIPKLVGHLHFPVQSGSDRILAQMKRNHTILEYKSKIRKLREARPDICISSDFIIGFPGETEADFQATMDLIEEISFDHSYSFIYSARPGTPAASLPDDVPMSVKKARLATLQARIREMGAAISLAMQNTTQQLLVEGVSKRDENQISGRTENNRIVNFAGSKNLIGQFVDVKITEAKPNSLRGELMA
jgi:tRNA-2-methylthio-N6-dimethylallyladenosine synthase